MKNGNTAKNIGHIPSSVRLFISLAVSLSLLLSFGGIATGLADNPAQPRNQIVVISDIHLGVDDAFAEIKQNKPMLVKFLMQLKSSQEVAELVIAGDLMDEWFLPMNYETPEPLSELNDAIVKNNQEIIDTVNQIIQEGNIRVTYVPGNHDMLFDEGEAERIFPGINQTRDAVGLGTYRFSNIAVEHGHRYNIACAPDPLSNTAITGGGSILPFGYFFTRIATSSIMEGKPASSNVFPEISPAGMDDTQINYFKYFMTWKGLMTALPVTESFSDKAIKTGIDGYTQPYAISDVIPKMGEDGKLTVDLFSGIVENWQERQAINNVPSPISAGDAIVGAAEAGFTDQQAQLQYFDQDASVKVVIFGHSHIAMVTTSKNLEGDSVISANSGTWIDHQPGAPTCTYVAVTPSQDGAKTSVVLYQFNADGTSTLLSEAQIDN